MIMVAELEGEDGQSVISAMLKQPQLTENEAYRVYLFIYNQRHLGTVHQDGQHIPVLFS